jgi:hypothetical protein
MLSNVHNLGTAYVGDQPLHVSSLERGQRHIARSTLLLLVFFSGQAAVGDGILVPPGYEKILVTQDEHRQYWPRMNNHGEIVFVTRYGLDWNTEEIMLFDGTSAMSLTDNDIRDSYPAINDAGDIAWTSAVGPEWRHGPTMEMFLLKNGDLIQLTDDDLEDNSPELNQRGDIVWTQFLEDGCRRANTRILLYSAERVQVIAESGHSDQGPIINDHGNIIFTRYFACSGIWTSDIVYLADGTETVIDGDNFQAQVPDLNNNEHAVWGYSEEDDFYTDKIAYWRDGVREDGWDLGDNPKLNDHGDVLFLRWDNVKKAWQAHAYLRGTKYQLTDTDYWNSDGDINNRTDIVIKSGDPATADIIMLRRLPFGDMNCDKKVTFDDVDGFTLALIDRAAYEAAYPDCDWWLADANDDRKVDFDDIDPFVECIIKGCER